MMQIFQAEEYEERDPIPRYVLVLGTSGYCRAMAQKLQGAFSGVHVEEVTSAQAWMKALANDHYDLVIAEISPPWAPSKDIVSSVRARRPGCPIILCTANDVETAAETLESGATTYLPQSCLLSPLFTTTIRAIMVQAQQQKALRDTITRYRDLFNNVPVGVYRSTPSGEILDTNPAMIKLLRYPDRARLLSINAIELYANPEDRMRWRETLANSGDVCTIEVRFKRYDGTTFWAKNSARLIRSPDGTPRYYEGILEDVTERREAEEALRAQTDELQTRERYLTQLNDITRAAVETSNFDKMLQLLADRMGELIQADGCFITLWDENLEAAVPAAAYGELRENYPKLGPVTDEPTMTAEVLNAGHPLAIEDVFNSPYVSPRLARRFPTRSILGIPLIVDDRKLGAALIAFNERHTFTEEELALSEQAGRQIALAIAKAQLHEELRAQREEEQEILLRLSQTLSGLTVPNAVVVAASRATQEALDAEYVSVLLFEDEGRRLVLAGGVGWQPEQYGNFNVDLSSASEEAAFVSSILKGSASEKSLPCPLNLDIPSDYRSIAAPLRGKGNVLGILCAHAGAPRTFAGDDTRLLSLIAGQMAVALERAREHHAVRAAEAQYRRLFIEARHQLAELEARQRVTQAILQTMDLDTRLNVVLEQAIALLKVDVGAIYLREGDTLRLVAHQGLGYEALARLSTLPAHAPSLQREISERWRRDGPDEVRAHLVSTLRTGPQDVGVIILATTSFDLFTPDQHKTLSALADQAAVAVENARLLQESHQQAEQMQQVLETVPMGMLLLDQERRVLLANPVARIHLEVLAPTAPGAPLVQLGHRTLEAILRPPKWGQWHEIEISEPRHRIFEVVARPRQAGSQAGWVILLQEVTEEREQQRRIEQQERLAAVGQLAAGIAHDFNNMLSIIILYAGLMEKDPTLKDSAYHQLAIIQREGRRAAQLIRQILDFSRESPTQRRPIALRPYLKEIVKLLNRVIPENIKIVTDLAPGAHFISGDPTKIHQAVTNLTVNARDAMPEGGTLRFHLEELQIEPGAHPPLAEMPPGRWEVLSISDTGTGIPPEMLPHIFEPFFTTKAPDRGTGLGLAQVHGIVGQHGGYIDVESQLNQGTTFTLYFPALTEEIAVYEEAEEIWLPGHGEVVLVVEDQPAVRSVIKLSLAEVGYRVLTAANGQEGIEIYRQHREEIDLVLTDVIMPDLGGKGLFKALKEINPEVKVVVMTGYPKGNDAQQLLTEKISGWLEKPIDPARLAGIVRLALDQ